jgi:CheY-like chemotaxis protein
LIRSASVPSAGVGANQPGAEVLAKRMGSLEMLNKRLLPGLRRYTRALAGDCELGRVLCQHAYAKLQSEEPTRANPMLHAYRCVSQAWREFGRTRSPKQSLRSQPEQRRVSRMSPAHREAFLLMAMEGLGPQETSAVMGTCEAEALESMAAAVREGGVSDTASILIIEDEFLLARELAQIVSELGHQVAGRARTRSAAQECLAKISPDLVLADIHLADESSGIDAVNDTFRQMGDVAVIFITAFPARLLCENRPSPTFYIGKPFKKEQVMSAITLNLYFGSRSHFNESPDDTCAPPLVKFA